jgi:hypothetical protein
VGEAFSRKSVLGAIAFLLIGGSGVLVVSQSAFAELPLNGSLPSQPIKAFGR